MTSGLPVESYDPTTKTGVGKTMVFAPRDFFIVPSFMDSAVVESIGKTEAVINASAIKNLPIAAAE
jgi:hypothetical protein